jgi:hypothetical protein
MSMARTALPLGLAALAIAASAAVLTRRRRLERRWAPPARIDRHSPANAAARRLDRASALLAGAALADSAVEHYRGSFHNKAMYVPLGVSALTLAASVRDAIGSHPDVPIRRDVVSATAVATGIVGTGFHFYNITKRPGGFSWLNLFYAAPLGAPAALSLAGLLGIAANRLRSNEGVPSAPFLARLVSIGLLGTAGEAGLLHFRGAYHNPAMMIPITAGPLAAALLARAASAPQSAPTAARWSLRLLAGVGVVGSAFHAYGIQRNMGGWRNWSQNLLNGPPLPAPPAFTALAMAGLAALGLIEEEKL